MSLVIVNTRCANLSSVDFGFRRLGITPSITADPDAIRQADRVVLPGVGTAAAAMRELERLQIIDVLRGLEQPVLGICLGMQMLTRQSSETKDFDRDGQAVPALGVINTAVERLRQADQKPLPHMGWNRTVVSDHPLFKGFEHEPWFYFVHSYAVPVGDYSIATSEYTQPFSAAIGQGNFMGVQFHPERSGADGARVLQNFLEISC